MVDVRKLIIFLKISEIRKKKKKKKKKTTKLIQSHTTPNLSNFLNMRYVHWQRQLREEKIHYQNVSTRE
jgi:hypothetical protein